MTKTKNEIYFELNLTAEQVKTLEESLQLVVDDPSPSLMLLDDKLQQKDELTIEWMGSGAWKDTNMIAKTDVEQGQVVGTVDVEIEDHVQHICEQLEDLSNELRGYALTEAQWQEVHRVWVSFGKTFAPCRPPQKIKRSKEWSKEDAYDDAMDGLK